jgi:hypothetical protein
MAIVAVGPPLFASGCKRGLLNEKLKLDLINTLRSVVIFPPRSLMLPAMVGLEKATMLFARITSGPLA